MICTHSAFCHVQSNTYYAATLTQRLLTDLLVTGSKSVLDHVGSSQQFATGCHWQHEPPILKVSQSISKSNSLTFHQQSLRDCAQFPHRFDHTGKEQTGATGPPGQLPKSSSLRRLDAPWRTRPLQLTSAMK